jgi:hypothetical protein
MEHIKVAMHCLVAVALWKRNRGKLQDIRSTPGFKKGILEQWYSTFFVRVPPDIISLQLCTPKLLVHNASYTYCIIYVPPKMSSRTPG